ncbi:hypothetical protein NQ317_015880, partial [Molorchus minor]
VCTLSALPWSVVHYRIEVIRRKRLFAIFHSCRLRDGTRGFLTAPKFIVGPFRSFGYANLTRNARTKFAAAVSRSQSFRRGIKIREKKSTETTFQLDSASDASVRASPRGLFLAHLYPSLLVCLERDVR